jgi:hypothetical protein
MEVRMNGVPVAYVSESISIEDTIGERSTASFTVWDETGTAHYSKGTPYQIFNDDNELLISGVVEDSKAKKCSPVEPGILHDITGIDNHYFADKRIAAKSYKAQTAGYIIRDLIQSYLADEGITASTQIQDGPVINEVIFNYIPVSDCIDSLAEKTRFWWNIDAAKQVTFVSKCTNNAPWELSAGDIIGEPVITRGNPQYRNKQYVLGGKATTDTLTETKYGDGNTKTYTVGFPIAEKPVIRVSGVEKTVGIKGTDENKDWYWAKSDPIITSDTELANGALLQITYKGEYPVIGVYKSDDQKTILRGIEGSGSGIVENVVKQETNDKDAALQYAISLIDQYATDGEKIQFKTDRKGLKPGQFLTVNLPEYGMCEPPYNQLLIESVHIQDDIYQLIYEVTASRGPIDGSWAKFFYDLMKPTPSTIRENLGENETLLIVLPYSKNWLPTESPNIFKELYPAANLYPSPTLYPQFSAENRINYVALIDENENEIFRNKWISQTDTGTGTIETTFYIQPAEGVGSIKKIYWYGGATASLYPGSGVRMAWVNYDHIKTNVESIQIQRTDTKGW